MKIKNIVQLLLLVSLFLFVACEQEKEPISVTGVTISQTTLELTEGDTQTLTAEVLPSNADNKTVSWTSSQAVIASVQDGVVTAHKVGTATVIVTTADGGKIATCEVAVKEKIYSVQSVSLNKTAMELTVGDETTLTATINPSNASNKNVTWTSSNREVAIVTDGKVSAIKTGKATITVTTEDGDKTASCEITVKDKVYPVESIALDKSEIELTEGDETTLTATINPSNASNKNVTWSSNKTSVATVADGKIVAVQAGNATITVKTEDGGKTATCKVTVKEKIYPVESISLDKTFVELMEGETLILSATITPRNATNKNMVWMSTDDSIASVDDKGKVTAIKEGTVIITVRTEDGDKTASCEINVLHDKSKDPIEFADEVMKEMCVSAFDTNNDGELSYKEASEVTSISKMTLTDKRFKSFDEFQYFTSVKTIPKEYFTDCSFQSIVLPEGLQKIQGRAFYGCSNLTSINIPAGVTSFGEGSGHVFSYCTNLTKVVFPENIKTFLGSNSFEYCVNLIEVILPNNLDKISPYMFAGCSGLKIVDIPQGVKAISFSAFEGCSNLSSINIPEGVTEINSSAFNGCSKLVTITLPTSLSEIQSSAFSGCSSLASVIIPDKIKKIDLLVFSGCSSLTKVILPEGIIQIGYSAFSNCTSLTSIVLPSSILTIEEGAFRRCSSLSSIFVKSSIPPFLEKEMYNEYDEFEYNAPSRKIYVPIESLNIYKTADGWSEYDAAIVGYDYENDKVVE